MISERVNRGLQCYAWIRIRCVTLVWGKEMKDETYYYCSTKELMIGNNKQNIHFPSRRFYTWKAERINRRERLYPNQPEILKQHNLCQTLPRGRGSI